MKNKESKIKALEIASIVINELEGSDCTESIEVKNELHKIALFLSKKADKLRIKRIRNNRK